jgi:hypothetical protein
MVSELAASDVMVLVYAFGAGAVAIVVLMIGLFGMFEADDRRALLNVLRHPFRVILQDSESGGEAQPHGDDVHSA